MKCFFRCQRGNTAMITGLLAIPMIVVIGAAVDLSRANTVRVHAAIALDSAILATAKELASGTDEAAAIAAGEATFAENISTLAVEANCAAPTITADLVNRRVIGQANCDIDLTIASVVRGDSMAVTPQAEAAYGGDKIEIALMLDVSGSMRGQRMTDLKAAANTLIDTLIPTSGTGDVRIALAPYSTAINAGSYGDVATGITDLYAHTINNLGADPNRLVNALANGGAGETFDLVDAIGTGGLGTLPQEFFACASGNWTRTVCGRTNHSSDGCDNGTWYTVDITALAPSAYPLHVCDSHLYFPNGENACAFSDTSTIWSPPHTADCIDRTGTNRQIAADWQALDWTAASLAYANFDFSVLGAEHAANVSAQNTNCVTERAGAEAFTNADPILFPVRAESSSCPRSAVEPLTDNTTILKDAINGLYADGWTAGQLGVAWSWYTLSPEWNTIWPFNRRSQADDTALRVRRYAILMTDGAFNTHYATGQGNSDVQARALCAAMRADGIEVFSVAFNAPASSQMLLRDCASSTSHYFAASSGAQLLAAYQAIAAEIGRVRLTQ